MCNKPIGGHLFQKLAWSKWGLSCLPDAGTISRNEANHDLVASYLERHPEEHAVWFDMQEGHDYGLILGKAEEEKKGADLSENPETMAAAREVIAAMAGDRTKLRVQNTKLLETLREALAQNTMLLTACQGARSVMGTVQVNLEALSTSPVPGQIALVKRVAVPLLRKASAPVTEAIERTEVQP